MASRILYLIRHGQHVGEGPEPRRNVGGLTAEGVEQARLTSRRLKRIPFRLVHCSTLRRAVETADVIHRIRPRSPIRKAHLLRELIPCVPYRSPGLFRGIRARDIARARGRAERVFARYFKRSPGKERHEVIVTHGNLIRYLICRTLGISPRAWLNMRIHNCGVSEIVVKEDGSLVLVSYNDTGHLPPGLVT